MDLSAAGAGTRNVRGRITDKDAASTTYAATVLSDDLITNISVPLDPVLVDTDVQVITRSRGPGEAYSATIVWDDGGAKTNRASVVSGSRRSTRIRGPASTRIVTVQGDQGSTIPSRPRPRRRL